MPHNKQFDDLVIVQDTVERVEAVAHHHNYYQFIFIRSGAGKHHLNDEVIDFQSGDLFFISPLDTHYFSLEQASLISSVRFTEHSKGKIKNLQKAWKGEFPGLKRGRSPLNIKVTFSSADLLVVTQLFDLLYALKNEILVNEAIIYIQLISLVSLIERNLSFNAGSVSELNPLNKKASLEMIYAYINRHLLNPEMLSATRIAAWHGLSVHYIGPYFKRHAGVTVKDYINNCKQQIIARKLAGSETSIAQLCADFNYADISHFNKSFKKYWGVSPAKYRMEAKNKATVSAP